MDGERARVALVLLGWQEDRVLKLEERAKLGTVVSQVVVAIDVPMDEGVITGDRDVVNDAHIAVLSTPYSNSVFTGRVSRTNQILSINYMEDLFVFV